MPPTQLLKQTIPIDPTAILTSTPDHDQRDALRAIRCPLCAWKPQASSRWCCDASDSPEPFFRGCGTRWNTFETRGRCPGCSHHWQWTSCLRCEQWSLHDDWYGVEEPRT